MEEKSFFQTKEGGLTIAFLVIVASFVIVMIGLYTGADAVSVVGFLLIVAAMLYSPVKIYIWDKIKSNK